jgi:hypothetical protein
MKKLNDRDTFWSLALVISLFFIGTGEVLSQPLSKEEAPQIKLGDVAFKLRELEATPPFRILEVHIEIINQSRQSVAPPKSIKVAVTPKETESPTSPSTTKFNLTPEETTLELPLPPRTRRTVILGYSFQTDSPESINFEVQINPPEGEKKTVTWKKPQTP